jgi:motility quorum-sensing regulator/GCU-specific mRNA interferase toxin
MEKRTPHYVLAEIQAIVADSCSRVFTRLALAGGLSLGLTEPEMREVVLSLSKTDFYKSMTTHMDHRLWQDVYHGKTMDGVAVYIKITGFPDNRPPVIQFKAK